MGRYPDVSWSFLVACLTSALLPCQCAFLFREHSEICAASASDSWPWFHSFQCYRTSCSRWRPTLPYAAKLFQEILALEVCTSSTSIMELSTGSSLNLRSRLHSSPMRDAKRYVPLVTNIMRGPVSQIPLLHGYSQLWACSCKPHGRAINFGKPSWLWSGG